MVGLENLSVELSADMAAELRAAVAGGCYASISEAVGDALETWRLQRRDEAIEIGAQRQLVQEGMESGPALDAEQVFATLRMRFGQSSQV